MAASTGSSEGVSPVVILGSIASSFGLISPRVGVDDRSKGGVVTDIRASRS